MSPCNRRARAVYFNVVGLGRFKPVFESYYWFLRLSVGQVDLFPPLDGVSINPASSADLLGGILPPCDMVCFWVSGLSTAAAMSCLHLQIPPLPT